jgi:chromosomal replication initiator protein
MTSLTKNWEQALGLLRDDLNETAYDAWFSGLIPLRADEKQHILYVGAESNFVIEMLNKRYLQMLEGAVEIAFKDTYKVSLQLETKDKAEEPKPEKPITKSMLDEEYYLNPRFSFENFVQGKNNEFAYSAAYAVAQAPAKQYNPLFLYGGSGLGKTHLMHAIGKYILEHNDNKKVLYVSSEMFTNELISAIRENKMSTFKKKYRTIDVLLIDDIQFIEGKDSTQEEFFYTFNTLYDNNKQIVISSDRSPKKLTSLDERLTSRFLWSVSADITPPDYETRVAILKNKAELENIEITEDVDAVINLICEKIKFNVRELEGAFTRIVSFSTLLHRPINAALARDILKEILSAAEMKVTIETVKKSVAKYYGITIKDMDSTKRTKNLTYPRQIAMYLCKEMTDSSFPKIGQSFGGKDHTTVLHACKKISTQLKSDEELKSEIDELTQIINEG